MGFKIYNCESVENCCEVNTHMTTPSGTPCSVIVVFTLWKICVFFFTGTSKTITTLLVLSNKNVETQKRRD